MNNLFQGYEFTHAYINNLMVITKEYYIDHVQELELSLNKLKESGLKCDIEKSFFVQTEMEYLGFWVKHYGIKPIYKN